MEDLRPVLTTYAYNITGSFEDALDIVQDVYVKFMEADERLITNVPAYLKRMVINTAINFKKRQERLLRDYPGEWLPEPVSEIGADTAINRREILSYSLMVLLERLNPQQRTVFILREAFDYDHSEIADLLGVTEENSRQLLSRARKLIKQPSPATRSRTSSAFLQRYIETLERVDAAQLLDLLTEQTVVIADGGGKASASLNPVRGRDNSCAYLSGIYRKFYHDKPLDYGTVNHQPALFLYDNGILTTCQIFTLDDTGKIAEVFIVRNPDKLKHLQKIC
ncbi:sigma-70 family RNA polymerase sigma factor [Pedobacter deserti]|uniref:sigma-70 family RNA polymerase sigma factor n=1 Tax=Pedobacter deserti TaxID=2817382 RepID=UPI00210E1CE1|nr:sigma-70 family RNA polymerase sigma factor [Pedobacter sp. SYSU D00382]